MILELFFKNWYEHLLIKHVLKDKVEKDMEKFEKGIADMERDMEDRYTPVNQSFD